MPTLGPFSMIISGNIPPQGPLLQCNFSLIWNWSFPHPVDNPGFVDPIIGAKYYTNGKLNLPTVSDNNSFPFWINFLVGYNPPPTGPQNGDGLVHHFGLDTAIYQTVKDISPVPASVSSYSDNYVAESSPVLPGHLCGITLIYENIDAPSWQQWFWQAPPPF